MAAEHDRLGPAEAFGQPPRTGRLWFDLLAALAAIFISTVSLVVAIRGERTQRGLLAANAWPFVQLSKNQTLEEASLDIENAGVGPAKIMTFELFYQGQPVDNTFDLLQRCCGLPGAPADQAHAPVSGLASGQVYGNVLRPGEHVVALRLKKLTTEATLFNRFTAAMPALSFRTCYCSILDECWTSDLRTLTQTAVRSCPVSSHPFAVGDGHDP